MNSKFCFVDLILLNQDKMKEKNFYNLPIDEFLFYIRSKRFYPAEYGTMIPKKIELDSKNRLNIIGSDLNRGDAMIGEKYYEVKTSFLNKKPKFNIKNIREWQKIDYYILVFVDSNDEDSPKDYKPYVYCISHEDLINHPVLRFHQQNSSKDSNMTNEGLSTTFDNYKHQWLFEKYNILNGNTYEDLMTYIYKESSDIYKGNVDNSYLSWFNKRENKKESSVPVLTKRSKVQKIYLDINGESITGDTNREVMVNMVKYIGPKVLEGVMWTTWLDKVRTDARHEYVGDGYWFNPKFSIRDIEKVTEKISDDLNITITIKNKKNVY